VGLHNIDRTDSLAERLGKDISVRCELGAG